MKPLFFLIFIAFSRTVSAQICPIDGQMTILKGNYIGDTLCTIDVQVSFKNVSFDQIYLINDSNICKRRHYKDYCFVKEKPTGCFDTTGLRHSKHGISFFIIDSLGNDVESDSDLPLSQICWETFPNYFLEDNDKPLQGFDAYTISRALGLPLKHIYEPFVWSFFRDYLRIKPILPFQTNTVVYSFRVKTIAKNLKPNTNYYLHAFYCADAFAKDLNEYIKPQLEFEVLSVAYKFEPVMFSLPGIKTK
jgi:hypothetical protein